MRSTTAALDKVGPENIAVAWHQLSVLIDDHPLPTHDELAWRAAVKAYRAAPDTELYRDEAVRRTFFRSPFAQLPRSAGNVFLYGALVVREGGRQFRPLLLLTWPLSLLVTVPGVLCHGVAAAGVRVAKAVATGRVARGLRERPEDDALVTDIRETLAQADCPKAVGDDSGSIDEETTDP